MKQKCFVRHPKSLHWLASKIKQRLSPNRIFKIWDHSGTVHFKPSQILEILYNFYSKLYSANSPHTADINSFFPQYNFNSRLSFTHKVLLEAPISEEEILEAIKKLKTNNHQGWMASHLISTRNALLSCSLLCLHSLMKFFNLVSFHPLGTKHTWLFYQKKAWLIRFYILSPNFYP